jgi:osmotically-inducible protein OsmY
MKTLLRITLCLLICAASSVVLASADDRRIEETARASYNYRTVLERRVYIESRDGIVNLSGTVEDKDYKALAADTIADVPGVVRIDNEIVIKSTVAEQSDAWIARKVRSRLLVKANVSPMTTYVAVKDRIVTLNGTAESEAQKDLTEACAAAVDHVKAVRNNLVVKASRASRPADGDIIDDISITSQVKYALLTYHSTTAIRPRVETQAGTVVVTGEAASEAEKAVVTKLTEGVRGVKAVNNAMTVKG